MLLLRELLRVLGVETPCSVQLRHQLLLRVLSHLVGIDVLDVLSELFDLPTKAVDFGAEPFPVLLLIR